MEGDRQRQISGLYHAALLRAVPERAAFVRAACGGDRELQHEVESLLALDSSAQNLLITPAVVAAASLMTIGPAASLIGRQLGAYRVDSFLGAGGMGEVYRARDTRLGRDVAIKILPHAFTADAARLARFEREARMLAALNHPHIAAIYGVEEIDRNLALVLELVDGETLADRLRRGPVPVREAVAIGRQIAEALEAAHEKGIVHRDLKPANIKITPDGVAKVLDFGLAKAASSGELLPDLQPPNVTVGGTREGVILGTAAYMSPEQARGQAIDKRTDIWAFGCVLFEMLTGQAPFAGDTVSDTIAKVLEREPDWQALPVQTPAKLRDLLRRCFQKDVHRRFRDAADIGIELEEAVAMPAEGQPATLQPSVPRAWLRASIIGLGALVLGATVAGFVAWNLKPTPPRPVNRFVITLPPGQQLAGLDIGPAVAVSPEGTQLAYVARQGE